MYVLIYVLQYTHLMTLARAAAASNALESTRPAILSASSNRSRTDRPDPESLSPPEAADVEMMALALLVLPTALSIRPSRSAIDASDAALAAEVGPTWPVAEEAYSS